jgi:integrase
LGPAKRRHSPGTVLIVDGTLVPTRDTVRLHDLRHTMVTLLLELGVPPHIVQAIAGHANIDVTMKVYAHANLDAMREAMGKFNDRLG